jgi:hypothetical protein
MSGDISHVSPLMKQIDISRRVRIGAALLVLAAAVPLAGNVDPKKGRVTENPTGGNSYSIDQEVDYGGKAVPVIQKELPLLPIDHPVSKYISALGQRLAAKAPGYKFPYTFRVVNQKEINAFALLGGPIYINTGTIAAANEAELAGLARGHAALDPAGVAPDQGLHPLGNFERSTGSERGRMGRISGANGDFGRRGFGIHQVLARCRDRG